MEGYPNITYEQSPPPYQMSFPSAPPETSEGIIKVQHPPKKQNMEVVVVQPPQQQLEQQPQPQRNRRREPELNCDINCHVNHCAYGILTFFTSGCCLPCWIGACFGYCPSLYC